MSNDRYKWETCDVTTTEVYRIRSRDTSPSEETPTSSVRHVIKTTISQLLGIAQPSVPRAKPVIVKAPA